RSGSAGPARARRDAGNQLSVRREHDCRSRVHRLHCARVPAVARAGSGREPPTCAGDHGHMTIKIGLVAVAMSCASLAAAQTWTAPRTPDGRPDLQGFWTNATITPLERPRDLGAKEFFTEDEAAAYRKRVLVPA